MPASDPPRTDPSDCHLLRCNGCGWDINWPAADAARAGCPACGAPVVTAAPTPARNKRLMTRRAARGGVRVELRRGPMGLGRDLALGLTNLTEDGLGVRVKAALRPREECELALARFSGGKPLKLQAEVCWCTPAGDGTFRVGLRFRHRLTRKDLRDLTK